jgi:hypothetical protein
VSPLPPNRRGVTVKLEIISQLDGQRHEGYITANYTEDGRLCEVFLAGWGKAGSSVYGWAQAVAVLLSLAVQGGAQLGTLTRHLGEMAFEPAGSTNDPEIPTCTSVPAYIAMWLALRFDEAGYLREQAELPAHGHTRP